MSTRVRIAVVNDFEVVVQGVAAMLAGEDGIDVVDATVGLPGPDPVDIALYDTFGAADTRLSDLSELLVHDAVGTVAVYTSIFSPTAVDAALGLGVRGYLSKALDGPDLAMALRRIAAGEQVVVDAPDARPIGGGRWPGEEQGLTAKESDVLALMVRGLENKAIADALYISVDTVKSRIRTLYQRIGASNRVEAVLWGIDHGFRPRKASRGPVDIAG